MSCNIDLEYLDRLSKMACSPSSFIPAGRSYNKMATIEAECIARIKRLHKEADIIWISQESINNIHSLSREYYKNNITQSDFLHTYESFLKQAILQRRWIESGITISIVDSIKIGEANKKRDYYLSRDWS
ncbi:hypothetical protein D0T84_16325 [Dysgonomonas sp. 521]|uniref:hypothetical protein n=1 Tax=Dysgonomonas sp. 521 TaxID=2302932 RepID=UPI0013D57B31|nr:hypothetical protein [Dysgonomonas sp. 521]NDV96468.1 hypothetical protein [Dysgonomonas sp. 521]